MRTQRTRRAAPAAALVAAGLLLGSGCGSKMPPSVAHPLVNGEAPEFESDATGDREVSVPGGFRTQVIVLDFWASWCAACNTSLPALDAIYRDHRDDGVMVIGVSVDESPGAAEATARELGATFPIVNDPYQRIAGAYGVAQVPLTFVIDGRNRVRWVGRDAGSARRAVDVVLAEGTGRRSAFE